MGVKRKSYTRRRKRDSHEDSKNEQNFGFLSQKSKPSVYHAVVVIFLEFFAWGLLTTPTLSCLR